VKFRGGKRTAPGGPRKLLLREEKEGREKKGRGRKASVTKGERGVSRFFVRKKNVARPNLDSAQEKKTGPAERGKGDPEPGPPLAKKTHEGGGRGVLRQKRMNRGKTQTSSNVGGRGTATAKDAGKEGGGNCPRRGADDNKECLR